MAAVSEGLGNRTTQAADAIRAGRRRLGDELASLSLPLNPRARRVATWAGAFAVLTVLELVLVLPLVTGASREAARSVEAATRAVIDRASPDERRSASSTFEDKSGSRANADGTGRTGGKGPNRGTPAVVAGDEAEHDAEPYSESVASSDESSASAPASREEPSNRPSDSSTGRASAPSGKARSVPVTPAAPLAPSPTPQSPSPQPQSPPPPPPSSSTTTTTRAAPVPAPRGSSPGTTTTTAKDPPPPDDDDDDKHSTTTTTTTTTSTTTTTKADDPPPPPPTTTSPDDCKKHCGGDDDDDD